MTYRKTRKDYIYYNSDLSKFIGEELPKIMTSIDVDLFQVKKSKRVIRIAEYKHEREQLGRQQRDALKLLADGFRKLNTCKTVWAWEVYLLRGNYPYKKLVCENLITNTKMTLYNEDVKKFLTMELLP